MWRAVVILFLILSISLDALSDDRKPKIVGQQEVSTNEETSREISVDDLIIEFEKGDDDDDDDDDEETENFRIEIVAAGDNYSVSGTSIIPSIDFNGVLSVPVAVWNDDDRSNTHQLQVQVLPVNDAPVVTGHRDIEIPNGGSYAITPLDVMVDDPDNAPDDFSVMVGDGDNYTRSENTITPVENFSGILSVPVVVSDGVAQSEPFNLQITANNENDVPEITGQITAAIDQGESFTFQSDFITVSDDDNDYPADFDIILSDGDSYSLDGFTITPEPDYFGDLIVPVSVNDGNSTSAPFDFRVEVRRVNSKPVIRGQARSKQVKNNESFEVTFDDLIVEDSDNQYPEDFTILVGQGENYSVAAQTVTPDEGFSGTLSIPVTVSDGSSESDVFLMQASVEDENVVPVITGQNEVVTNEEQSVEILLQHLIVDDPDNTYPDDFALIVSEGTDYTVSGNSIVPVENFFGTLSVNVAVNDGTDTSAPFSLQVTVNNVNDAPVIEGQSQAVSTQENQPVTLTLGQLNVTDDSESTTLSLLVYEGANYTVSGTTITPTTGYSGSLDVSVAVTDGSATSEVFTMAVSVGATNDQPIITGQVAVSTPESQPVTLLLEHLTVTDPDNTYPDDFTLTVSPGENYDLSGNTVTPHNGFNGALQVPVTVSDGTAMSEPFTMQVQVSSVNSRPVITGQVAAQTAEDQPYTIQLNHLTVSDADNTYPEGFTLQVYPGENYTFTENTVTPAPEFAGTLSVPVTVNDGVENSDTYNFVIEVLAGNDIPQITGQVPLTIQEDTPLTLDLSHLTVADPDGEYPTGFTLQVAAGENYISNGNIITPTANFSGQLLVPVSVSNGVRTSNTFNLTVDVTPVNDPPTVISQVPLTTGEDTPITVELSHLTVTDPDNVYPTGFSLIISPGENYTVNGSVITPAENFTGTLNVPIAVSDGTAQSNAFNLQITVGGSNDAPVISGQVPLQTNEDQPITIEFAHLSVSDADNPYPQGFTIVIQQGANYTVNDRTITPTANYNGVLTVPVAVSDGTSLSNTFNLTITVTPVNDAPVVTGQSAVSIFRNAAFTIEFSHLTVTDVDNSYPGGFSISVGSGSNYSVVQNTITPALDFVGQLTIPVSVSDGSSTSAVWNFVINVVAPPNVVPVIVSNVNLLTYENQPLELQLSHFVVNDPDNVYPDDFTLTVLDGENYSSSGTTITPSRDFSGMLDVPVRISDLESTSEIYHAFIQVLPVSDVPLITGQQFLRINEDDSINIALGDLIVLDPDSNYPNGFTLSMLAGENYSINGNQIKPAVDFSGYLSVPTTVNDGENTSPLYQLLILVDPVNDAPVITGGENSSTVYDVAGVFPFDDITITDSDNDTLSLAEIDFAPSEYQAGIDSIVYPSHETIRVVLDQARGVLLMFGKSSIEEYQNLIRSVAYFYNGSRTDVATKSIRVRVSDGRAESNTLTQTISFDINSITLLIPTGFTPNGDGANDTWVISTEQGSDAFNEAVVKVFNKRGALVFEATGIDTPWDGTRNGVLLPADTYFYTIDLQSSASKNRYRGIITLLR